MCNIPLMMELQQITTLQSFEQAINSNLISIAWTSCVLLSGKSSLLSAAESFLWCWPIHIQVPDSVGKLPIRASNSVEGRVIKTLLMVRLPSILHSDSVLPTPWPLRPYSFHTISELYLIQPPGKRTYTPPP